MGGAEFIPPFGANKFASTGARSCWAPAIFMPRSVETRHDRLMAEVTHAGEHHGDAVRVGRSYHFIIPQ